MRIATVCNTLHPGLCRLYDSVKAHGMQLDILGMNAAFTSVSDKFVYMLKWLREDQRPADDEIVLFVDAYDAVVVDTEDTILAKINDVCPRIFGDEILVSGELNCFPDATLTGNYDLLPESARGRTNRYKYLNSGVYAGTADSIRTLLSSYALGLGTKANDQALFTKTYLDCRGLGPIKVDVDAEVFQSMWGIEKDEVEFCEGRGHVVNNVTQTRPCVIHGNGGSSIGPALEYLRGI